MSVAGQIGSALVASAGTAASMPLVIKLMRAKKLVDMPNDRSMHVYPVVLGGGLAIAIGSVLALAIFVEPTAGLVVSLLAVLAFGALGLRDDFENVPARTRLVIQLPIAFAVSIGVFGSAIGWVVLGGLFVLAFTNAFNFMDGANGVSAVTAMVAGVSFAAMSTIEASSLLLTLGLVIAASAIGFLPFNYPTARVFMGDTGSYFLGSLIAGGVLVALDAGVHWLLALSPTLIYGIDTSTTLFRRWREGKQLTDGHREHVYQRLTANHSHYPWVAPIVGAMTIATVLAGSLATTGTLGVPLSLAAMAAISGLYLSMPAWIHEAASRLRLATKVTAESPS